MATKYTLAQLADLWRQAGGSASAAPFAAAVAMAESGGNPGSLNHNSNGTTDRGLWQINSVHGSLSTMDPVANARAAVQISANGTNWRPWCTAWSNGHCGGTFLGAGSPVYQFYNGTSVPTGGGVATVGGNTVQGLNVSNPFDPQSWANAFLHPIFVSIFYSTLGVVGIALMGVGVWLLVRESQSFKVVQGFARKAAVGSTPAGAAVGAATEEKDDSPSLPANTDSDEDRGRHAAGGGRHRGEA